jgi:hypothetical protein
VRLLGLFIAQLLFQSLRQVHISLASDTVANTRMLYIKNSLVDSTAQLATLETDGRRQLPVLLPETLVVTTTLDLEPRSISSCLRKHGVYNKEI